MLQIKITSILNPPDGGMIIRTASICEININVNFEYQLYNDLQNKGFFVNETIECISRNYYIIQLNNNRLCSFDSLSNIKLKIEEEIQKLINE